MASRQNQNQGDIVRSFTLGNKEFEGKTSEFQYDRGQYSITDVVGEERNVVYKSRNAQEAYTKWNVYIGRKKERPERSERRTENASGEDRQGRSRGNREEKRDNNRENNRSGNYNRRQEHENRSREHKNERLHEERGGYNQGFTAAQQEDSRERGQQRNRRRRNNRREK
jgi:hypothetical protein